MLWVGKSWNRYRLALKLPDVPWNHHPKFKVKDKNNFNHHPYYFLFRLFCVHMVAACSSWNFQWLVVILVITCVICILSSWTFTAPVSILFLFFFIYILFDYYYYYYNLTGYETSTNAVSRSHSTCTPQVPEMTLWQLLFAKQDSRMGAHWQGRIKSVLPRVSQASPLQSIFLL